MLRHLVILFIFCAFAPDTGLGVELEGAPIHYQTRQPQDRMARLQTAIAEGKASLKTEDPLRTLLNYLEIPAQSQVLVFSKTSAQNSHISPDRPRAIYYSDDCYVGYVQGGNLEVLTFDAHMGGLLYLVNLHEPEPQTGEPTITRPESCLNCHQRSSTEGVPGGLVRSVFPREDGLPLFQAGTFYVGPETKLEHRWGGWYVTGNTGKETHMGNALATETADGRVSLNPISPHGIQLESLDQILDCSRYPGGAASDVVSLMILEHQVAMHNLLAAANLNVRQLAHRTAEMHRAFQEPVPAQPEGVLKRVIDSQADRIVRALLFEDEYVIEGDGVDGGEAFQNVFARNARVSRDGRSLKDLRLYERLFKTRCSYVIYSEVFDHLPPLLKDEVYRQLDKALTQPSARGAGAHLSAQERSRIREILLDTKPDLAAAWQNPSTP